MPLARYHGGRLDLDTRVSFDEAHDLHERHRRIMCAKDLAVDHAKLFQVCEILVHIDDIPSQSHEMRGLRVALGEDRRDIAERLPDLLDKTLRQTAALWLPAA